MLYFSINCWCSFTNTHILSCKHTLSQQFGYRLQLTGEVCEIHAVFSQLRTNFGLTEGFWLENTCVPKARFQRWLYLNRGCFCQDLSTSVSPLFPLMHFHCNHFCRNHQHVCQSTFKKMFVKISKVITIVFLFFWKKKWQLFWIWKKQRIHVEE